jgi:hypothetical protein
MHIPGTISTCHIPTVHNPVPWKELSGILTGLPVSRGFGYTPLSRSLKVSQLRLLKQTG